MITDRCSTTGLLFILSHRQPSHMFLFLSLSLLDLSSHWIHMYASKAHHKNIDTTQNIVLRVYYGFKPLFGFCCIGAELYYLFLYVLSFEPTFAIASISLVQVNQICLVAAILKNIVNVFQLMSAVASVVQQDAIQEVNTKGQ